ncbi:MAG: MBL fold metallo-hydrolase [Chthoniobacterales bacterium]
MKVVVLGTAAGGGFPQWNCGCPNCADARRGVPGLGSRLQSGLAVSAGDGCWFLINASPDIARQIERFLRPRADLPGPRDSPIAGVLLTNADLDHCLGLFALREGPALTVWCPDSTRRALVEGLRLHDVLGSFCGVTWVSSPFVWQPLGPGLEVRTIALRGADPPRYTANASGQVSEEPQAVGYLFRANPDAGIIGVFPDVAKLDEELLTHLRSCSRVFFDGTFWTADEMVRLGFSDRDAAAMGHVPVSGPGGSLPDLAALPGHVSYVHVNNTNPMLRADSPERRAVEEAGLSVADDGAEFLLGGGFPTS